MNDGYLFEMCKENRRHCIYLLLLLFGAPKVGEPIVEREWERLRKQLLTDLIVCSTECYKHWAVERFSAYRMYIQRFRNIFIN